jgi:hypothetical protein
MLTLIQQAILIIKLIEGKINCVVKYLEMPAKALMSFISTSSFRLKNHSPEYNKKIAGRLCKLTCSFFQSLTCFV